MLAPNPIHHGPRHFLTVFSLPVLSSRIGAPEDTLIIPPVMKARTSCSAWPPQSELAGQLHEDNVSGDLVRSASGRDNEQIVTVASEAGTDRYIVVQGLSRACLDRQQAALAELATPHHQAIFGEIVPLEAQRLRNAKSRRGEKAEQMVVGVRPDRSSGRKIERRVHNRAYLMQFKKMRCRPRSLAAAKRTGGRNFMPGVLGIHEYAETARRVVA